KPAFGTDASSQARAVCYAAKLIARRKDLKYALDNRPHDILPEAITVAYARMLKNLDTDNPQPPTPEQADSACYWRATRSGVPPGGIPNGLVVPVSSGL